MLKQDSHRKARFVVATCMMAVAISSMFVLAGATASAAATPSTQTLNACSLLTPANAASGLREAVTATENRTVGGFSQCVYSGNSGLAVVFEVASNAMLQNYNGTTANRAYESIKAHNLRSPLNTLGRDRIFAPGLLLLDLKHGVVYDDTFVFFHGRTTIAKQTQRLSRMLVPVSKQL